MRAAADLSQGPTCGENDVPAPPRACRARDSRDGDVSGAETARSPTAAGSPRRSGDESWPWLTWPTPSSTPTATTRSSAIGCSPTRPALSAGAAVTAQCGGSRPALVKQLRQEARQEREAAGPPAQEDRVHRDFTADAPDQLGLTDISEHPIAEGNPVSLRGQRRLLQPDRRLLDQRPDEGPPRGRRVQLSGPRRAIESSETASCLVRQRRATRQQLRSRSSPGSNGPTTTADANHDSAA